jgi:hypothetical protein
MQGMVMQRDQQRCQCTWREARVAPQPTGSPRRCPMQHVGLFWAWGCQVGQAAASIEVASVLGVVGCCSKNQLPLVASMPACFGKLSCQRETLFQHPMPVLVQLKHASLRTQVAKLLPPYLAEACRRSWKPRRPETATWIGPGVCPAWRWQLCCVG